MKTYEVKVAVSVLQIYEVEAETAEEAEDNWSWGALVHTNDEALETEILSIKEIDHD